MRIVLRVIIAVIVVIVAVFYYTYDPNYVEFIPKCQILATTGYLCPGCGMQRAVHSLLHLDIFEALRANGFFVFLISYFAVGWLFEKAKRHHNIDKVRGFLYNNIVYWMIVVAMALFTIFRNL